MGKAAKLRKIRQIFRDLVSVHRIRNGDVVLVRANSDLHANMDAVANALGRTGRPDCIMVATDDLESLVVLNEEAMNEKGWYRKDEKKGV